MDVLTPPQQGGLLETAENTITEAERRWAADTSLPQGTSSQLFVAGNGCRWKPVNNHPIVQHVTEFLRSAEMATGNKGPADSKYRLMVFHCGTRGRELEVPWDSGVKPGVEPGNARVYQLALYDVATGKHINIEFNICRYTHHDGVSPYCEAVRQPLRRAQPTFQQAWPYLQKVLLHDTETRTPLLISHYGRTFDCQMLLAELIRAGKDVPPELEYLDTFNMLIGREPRNQRELWAIEQQLAVKLGIRIRGRVNLRQHTLFQHMLPGIGEGYLYAPEKVLLLAKILPRLSGATWQHFNMRHLALHDKICLVLAKPGAEYYHGRLEDLLDTVFQKLHEECVHVGPCHHRHPELEEQHVLALLASLGFDG